MFQSCITKEHKGPREGSHYGNSPSNLKKRFPNKPNPKTLKQTMLGNFANVVVDLAIGG
jgi:hypothetical protein